MSAPRIALVVAAAENGVIGKDGAMPWRLPGDLKHFRTVTMGKPLIMGRKTFESIGKPLDGRDNIVISRSGEIGGDGVLLAASAEEALLIARRKAADRGADEITVIGGGEIYRSFLPLADRIYLTRVHGSPEGDTYFPGPDPALWTELSREKHAAGPRDTFDFSIIVLEKAAHPDQG